MVTVTDWRVDNAQTIMEQRLNPPIFRRKLRTPKEDFWHTIRVGMPIGLVLLLVMPFIFNWIF